MELGFILIALALLGLAGMVAFFKTWSVAFIREGEYVRYCKVCHQKYVSVKERPSIWIEEGPRLDHQCVCHKLMEQRPVPG